MPRRLSAHSEKTGGGSANCTAHPFATTAALFTTAAIPAVVLFYCFSCLVMANWRSLFFSPCPVAPATVDTSLSPRS
ncbi:protein of unknown function [Paraburkholderia kururiensis]